MQLRKLSLFCITVLVTLLVPVSLQATPINVGYWFTTNISAGINAFVVVNETGLHFLPADGFPVATSLTFQNPVFELHFSSGSSLTTNPDLDYPEDQNTSTYQFSESLELTQVLFFATLPANTQIVLDDGSIWNAGTAVTGTLSPLGTFIDATDFGLISIDATPATVPEPGSLWGLVVGCAALMYVRGRFSLSPLAARTHQ